MVVSEKSLTDNILQCNTKSISDTNHHNLHKKDDDPNNDVFVDENVIAESLEALSAGADNDNIHITTRTIALTMTGRMDWIVE